MSALGWVLGMGPSGFGYNSTAESVTAGLDLSGRTILLTGSNSGLGLETVRVLTRRGAHVVALARTMDKARHALAGTAGTPIACDLAEPESIRHAVAAISDGPRLDALICNAGIMGIPERTVRHGLELQFLTNHVGHQILVTSLIDRLAAGSRVVVVSSRAHARTYDEGIRLDDLDAARDYTAWGAYGQSKLANVLFARELSRRLADGAVANSLHPGVIATPLWRHMPGFQQAALGIVRPLFLKSIPQGAATQTWLAVHPDAAERTGTYHADCNPTVASAHGQDDALAAALWDRTERIIANL